MIYYRHKGKRERAKRNKQRQEVKTMNNEQIKDMMLNEGYKLLSEVGTYLQFAKGDWNNYKSKFEVVTYLNGNQFEKFNSYDIGGYIRDLQ